MAKSARSSVNKKNNQRLKSKVFGPVEQARAERLSAKLQELTQAPKPRDVTKMDVDDGESGAVADVQDAHDQPMDSQVRIVSNTAMKKAREAKKSRVEKKKVRKERNKIAFKPHRMKGKTGKK